MTHKFFPNPRSPQPAFALLTYRTFWFINSCLPHLKQPLSLSGGAVLAFPAHGFCHSMTYSRTGLPAFPADALLCVPLFCFLLLSPLCYLLLIYFAMSVPHISSYFYPNCVNCPLTCVNSPPPLIVFSFRAWYDKDGLQKKGFFAWTTRYFKTALSFLSLL